MSTLVRPNQTPVERCRYVADLIEAHPENFNMEWFAQDADGSFGTERALYDTDLAWHDQDGVA